MEQLAYTLHQAADAANISRSLIYKCIGAGLGPRFRKAGNRTILLKEDLEAWLRSLPYARPGDKHPDQDVPHGEEYSFHLQPGNRPGDTEVCK